MLSPFNVIQRKPFSGIQPTGVISNSKTNLHQPSGLPKQKDLSRVLNFYADYSGCGHWRMIWPESLLRINKNKIKFIKIASSDINDFPLLKEIKKYKKKVIISTGMSNEF